MQIIDRKFIHGNKDGSELIEVSKSGHTGEQCQVSLNSWNHLVFRRMDPRQEKLIVFDASETKEIIGFFRKLKDNEVPF